MPQLEDLQVEWVSLVDRAAVRDPQNKSEPRRFLLWKRDGTDPDEGESVMPDDDLQAQLDKAEEERDAALEATKKAEEARDEAIKAAAAKKPKAAKDGDTDEEDSQGGEMSKADRERLEKAERENAALNERLTKAEKAAEESTTIAKEERDRRVTSEFITKAEGYRALPVNPVEFGPVLKRASEGLSKEDYNALEGILRAADEQISKGALFKELGSSVGGSRVSDDAYGEVQRKAAELRKADSKLTKGEAEAQAMREDPDLQARYLAEMRG